MIAGPTFKLLKKTTLRSFDEIARKTGRLVRFNKSNFEYTIKTSDKETAEIIVRSAEDPDSLRGPNLSGAWIDEASYTAKDVFNIVIASLREAGELGWLSSTFTPRGKLHWTYDIFGVAKPNTELFHCATKDNPFLHADFEETVASSYTEHMKLQELGGEFVDDGGSLIHYDHMISCQDPDCLWINGAIPQGTRPDLFLGIDVGRTRDRTVIWTWEKVADLAITREVKVLHNVDFRRQREEIQQRLNTRRVVACYIDKGAIGLEMAMDLEKLYPGIVTGVQLTGPEGARIANRFAVAIEQRSVRIPDDPTIRQDFQLVSQPQTSAGRDVIKTERDETGHADRFWAASLGYDALASVQAPSFRRPLVRR